VVASDGDVDVDETSATFARALVTLKFVQVNVPHSSNPLSRKTRDGSRFFFSLKTKEVIRRNA
jgi:hypothetical protein